MIKNYGEFVSELLKAGFSVAGGGGDEGVFSLIGHGWSDMPPDSPVQWHTGDPETDPWEWRMRVLDERDDIAYAKIFFKKAGYITEEWYPYFLAARRKYKTFADAYADGTISNAAKRVYDAITSNGRLPLHEIKNCAGFAREDKSKFDGALTELQMKMHVTICGRRQKLTKTGEEYGWSSTVFCIAEDFFGGNVNKKAAALKAGEAAEKIAERIYELNPSAQPKKVEKFIYG